MSFTQCLSIVRAYVKKEMVFFAFFALLILLTLLSPAKIPTYPSCIDWRTIISLAALIIISNGLRESGYFEFFAEKVLVKFHSERLIALFFIGMSFLLSAILTNDVTLFIVVPLTLSLQNILKNDLKRLILFEAIAANVGSTLTPIGNPQNLFLWHRWDISFTGFIREMAPLALLLIILLVIWTIFVFPGKKLEITETVAMPKQKPLFYISLFFMLAFLVLLQLKLEMYALPVIIALYFLFNRKVLAHIDWILILLFIVIFIDFSLLSEISIIREGIGLVHLETGAGLFLFSALSSQIVSNVPAAVLISQFSDNYKTIAYGVNVGGQGFMIGSLANLIALRLLDDKKSYLTFHLYSVPFFIVSALLCLVLFIL